MAVGNGFDVSDDEEEPQYPSDFEECPVDDVPEDENNNNHKPQIVIPNNDPVVYYSEDEEEEPDYIDDYYVDDNVNNHEIMISRENVVDYFNGEFEHHIPDLDIFQGFGSDLEEEEFVNGLLNVDGYGDDFEYEFEFFDDGNSEEEEEVKGLNSVVREFPNGFGQTGSVMYEKRKVSAVRDFPDGFGSGVPMTDKRTESLEEVQEKSVQEPVVKKRKTSDVRDFSDQGRVVILALQAPQFCPWRDKNGNLKKARSRVSRRGN